MQIRSISKRSKCQYNQHKFCAATQQQVHKFGHSEVLVGGLVLGVDEGLLEEWKAQCPILPLAESGPCPAEVLEGM